jgi:prepilin-type N-terminal cleavage/methylation domain-containing protein/prepilin-type processing-associated H-X9-DG protein
MEDSDRNSFMQKKGFTLIELLVVVAVIAMLVMVLAPALLAAKDQGRAIVCQSNLRQLGLANLAYALDNKDNMVLAASDIYSANLHRWHSARETINDPFDPRHSDLIDYMGGGEVRQCPQPVRFRQGDLWDFNYEDGCGGYGYNIAYLGSRQWGSGAMDEATKTTEIRRPAETIMFADCAMPRKDADNSPYLQEYSFVQPPFFVLNGEPMLFWGIASPSIHFRHRQKANVVWADSHVTSAQRTDYNGKNAYGVRSADFEIGWFSALDNSLFDLE